MNTSAGRSTPAKWATTLELAAAMADYIDNFYNSERRHSYLSNISPPIPSLNSHNHGSKRWGQIKSLCDFVARCSGRKNQQRHDI